MKKLHITTQFLFTFLFLFISVNIFGQDPCTPQVSYTTKKVYCLNDGAIDVSIANIQDFEYVYYWVVKDGDTEPFNPINSTSPVITGLIPGTYTLNVTTVSKSVSCGTEAKTTSIPGVVIETETRGATPFWAAYMQSSSRLTSLNAYNTGQISLQMSGGSGNYIVKIENCPTNYTGQKVFLVPSATTYILDNLAPSTTQTYRVSISDGCESVVVDAITILPVKNDMPDYDYDTYVRYVQKDFFPYTDYKALRISAFVNITNNDGRSTVNNDGTINTNDYFNSKVGSQFYEVGFSYTNSYASVNNWQPLTAGDYIFNGSNYYSYVRDPQNQVAGKGFPYIFLRLKDTDLHKVFYSKLIMGGANTNPTINITPTVSGLNLKIPYLSDQPLTLPYTLKAVKQSSPGSGTEISQTINIPMDNNYQIIPEINLDWNSGTWAIYLQGAAGGDTALSIYIQDIKVGTMSDFFSNVSWRITKYMNFICGSGFGNQRVDVGITIPSVQPASVNFSKVKFTTTQDIGLPLEYTISGTNTCHLTSSTADGKEMGYKNVPPGTYNWKAVVYDLNDNPVYTKDLSYPILSAGNIAAENSFSLEQKPSNLCYGRKVVLKNSELRNVVKWTKSNGQVVPGRALVQFYKIIRSDYGSISYSSNVQISTANFTFPTGSDVGRAGSFTLEHLAAATSQETLEFNITESGEYTAVVMPMFGSEDIPEHGLSGGSASWGFGGGVNPSCYKMTTFSISENDMASVKLDETSSGAFRCNTESLGSVTVNVTSTQPDNVQLVYTITATDATGTPLTGMGNPVIDQTQKLSRTHTVNNIPAGVNYLKLEVAPTTCLLAPATYIMQVYNLSSSTLLSYKGGIRCENGQPGNVIEDLVLRAVNLPSTTYKWYYVEGGVEIPVTNGNSNIVTIPAAEFKAGLYRCDLSNSTCGVGVVYPHYLNVTADGSTTLYWAVDATDSNWNYMGNWRTADGDVATYIPSKCTDVVIPGKVNNGSFFPSIRNESTGNECRNIIFRYGAQIYHTERLNYDKAIIEYNFGYYGTMPANDDVPSQPLLNADLGLQPHGQVDDLKKMDRNRWWMISAPVKDMYTGDFQMDGKPFVYNALYNRKIDRANSYVVKPTPTSVESISIIGDNNIALNNSSNCNAMLLWVPAYTKAKGGEQNILEAVKGKIVCSTDKASINKYNMRDLAVTGSNPITRSQYAGRFVYEDNPGTLGADYQLDINADATRTDGLVMIGNPFMGAMNMNMFYTMNNTVIDDYFKILTPDGWKEYTSSTLPYVAPLQGFVIRLKNPAMAASLKFYYAMYTAESAGRNIRPI